MPVKSFNDLCDSFVKSQSSPNSGPCSNQQNGNHEPLRTKSTNPIKNNNANNISNGNKTNVDKFSSMSNQFSKGNTQRPIIGRTYKNNNNNGNKAETNCNGNQFNNNFNLNQEPVFAGLIVINPATLEQYINSFVGVEQQRLKLFIQSAISWAASYARNGTDETLTKLLGTLNAKFKLENEDLPKHARYKTELCRAFEEAGECKYGIKCQFAHGITELRVSCRHPKYKTEYCRTFHTTGYCAYGPRCHFVHNLIDPRNAHHRARNNNRGYIWVGPMPVNQPPIMISGRSNPVLLPAPVCITVTNSMGKNPVVIQVTPSGPVVTQVIGFDRPPSNPRNTFIYISNPTIKKRPIIGQQFYQRRRPM